MNGRFQKGQPRAPTAGRQPGVPNKKRSLEAIAEEMGFDFLHALATIAADIDHPRRFDAIKEGCQYIIPKMNANSVSLNSDLASLAEEFAKMTTEEIEAWIKSNASRK